jgi:hypothetical protein
MNTGRSGSTLLSLLLQQNRKLLSCSEFLDSFAQIDRNPQGPIDAEALVGRLSGCHELGLLLGPRAISLDELVYEADMGRHNPGLDMPTALVAAIPSLDPEHPDVLFDDMLAWGREQPTRTLADHYRALLSWLCDRFGRTGWVERSGANLRHMDETRAMFPNGRFLHLHRDGPECALSMMNQNWFVLATQYHENRATESEIEEALRNPRQADDDPVYRYYTVDKPPPEAFGRYWTYQICKGYQIFAQLPPEQLLDVRFETLVADPVDTLGLIEDFFELPADPGWKERAADLVRGKVKLRVPELADDARDRLEKACLPGQILLNRADGDLLDENSWLIRNVRNRILEGQR